jgi:protein DJ-1
MAISTITYDTLVRAGISCVSAYVTSSLPAAVDSNVSPKMLACKGSRGIRIIPDTSFPQTKFSSGVSFTLLDILYYVGELGMQDKYDILVIPGGAQGAATISKSEAVQDLVREFIKEDKIVGMICAGASSFLPSALYIPSLSHTPPTRKSNSTHLKTAPSTTNLTPKCQIGAREAYVVPRAF